LDLSAYLNLSLPYLYSALVLLLLAIHLILPSPLLSVLFAPITILVPLKNTLFSVSREINEGKGKARDSSQWVLFWVVWAAAGCIEGWVRVYRPGWRGWIGIWRTGVSLGLAGPWLGKDALVGLHGDTTEQTRDQQCHQL
jgi:hypothetical protein